MAHWKVSHKLYNYMGMYNSSRARSQNTTGWGLKHRKAFSQFWQLEI